MKKILNYLHIIVLTLVLFLALTSCRKYDETVNSSLNLKQEVQADKTSTSETMVSADVTNSMVVSTVSELSQKSNEYADRQAVEAVCIEMYGKDENDHIDYLIDTASELSKQTLGNVVSE